MVRNTYEDYDFPTVMFDDSGLKDKEICIQKMGEQLFNHYHNIISSILMPFLRNQFKKSCKLLRIIKSLSHICIEIK